MKKTFSIIRIAVITGTLIACTFSFSNQLIEEPDHTCQDINNYQAGPWGGHFTYPIGDYYIW